MDKPLELSGPGEHGEPANVPGEALGRPIPVGDAPVIERAADPSRLTQELQPIDSREGERTSEYNPHSLKHRTGTDHDARPVIRAQDDLTEQRLDRSAHDLHRENAFELRAR